MLNSTITQVFLPDARRAALSALAYMEQGINRYAVKPKSNPDWVQERREYLGHLAAYITQLEQTVRLQNEELSRQHNEGFAAGYRKAQQERNDDPLVPQYYADHTHLGKGLRSWLNEVKDNRK